MKKLFLTFLSAAIALGAFAERSEKRGVSENEFQFKAQIAAIAPGVSWFYNWGPSVGRYLANETAMEFVPMCWNGNFDAEAIRTYVGNHPEVKYLLGFNEPNFTNQANMTPAQAAARWPEVRALAAELGLQLVAPALNYSPNPPYQNPVQWMDEFVAIVGNDAFDFTAVHSYGGFGVMKDLAETFHQKYGKPVWVTEFCYWPEEGNPNCYVAPEAQIATMMQSVEWLEKTEWISRYAWFKAIGNSNVNPSPNFGLLISGHGEDPRELSEQGLVYENMWNFDKNSWFAVGEWIPASHYISQYGALLGSVAGSCPENPLPIEISRFNGGAWLDYQFDVPRNGDYMLTLKVSGQGEPRRFDPVIEILSVNADGEAGETLSPAITLSLPGADDQYDVINFKLSLKAGHQTLRIADANASRPSGMRIAAVRLADSSGVDDVAAEENARVDVFSADGVCIRHNADAETALEGLPAGLYIANGKKIIRH